MDPLNSEWVEMSDKINREYFPPGTAAFNYNAVSVKTNFLTKINTSVCIGSTNKCKLIRVYSLQTYQAFKW